MSTHQLQIKAMEYALGCIESEGYRRTSAIVVMLKRAIKAARESYPVTYVSKGDIAENPEGNRNVDHLDEETLAAIAEDMGEAYTSTGYWIDLDSISEKRGVPLLGHEEDE